MSIFSHIYYDRPWGSSLNVASDISNDNALGEGEDNREVLTDSTLYG
ncbi:MAG TPA: hypothetical protein VFR94_19060 [Nitrososphaeraceae archaeon]|nr:hypothetical protein [Nitrososphaeraceae archaeon]